MLISCTLFAKNALRRRRCEVLSAVPILLALALTSGCDQRGSKSAETDAVKKDVVERPGVSPDRKRIAFSELPVAPRPAVDDKLLTLGDKVYAANCAVCHGEKGDGKGAAAPFLVPAPRDFITANYRLRSTPTGQLPTDEDLFRAVSLGLPGTPMPPWRFILSDEERWAVVEHLKRLSPRFQQEKPQIVDLGKPPARTDALVKAGAELFHKYNCYTCHGETGVGDGPQVALLVNDAQQQITPRNLTRPAVFKSGYSTRDITRAILTGFNGTPMVGFAGTMPTSEAWTIAYYIESLAKPTPMTVAQASRDELSTEDVGKPDVNIRVIERAWKYEPNTIRVKQGQVVQITFEPTDNGLGAGHGFAISGYDEVAFLNGAMVGVPKSVKFRASQPGQFTFYCATQCSTEKLHPLMNGTLVVEETGGTRTASANEH